MLVLRNNRCRLPLPLMQELGFKCEKASKATGLLGLRLLLVGHWATEEDHVLEARRRWTAKKLPDGRVISPPAALAVGSPPLVPRSLTEVSL